ncbi:unnamed protein product [Nezara viridula]|uniref:N-terminal Ras-GEF domain-containing protein n=1 Tax=Nezara viridula TaxID=85310 RepID=A0A9P0HQF1_NEZVI|nr:unnamed protein product [Nezara viridula]
MLQAVVYREGNLVSGRLEALIQHMVPTNDYYPDRAFLFAFLLTSRLFVKPHDLLGQICNESSAKEKMEGPSQPLIRLIGEWSETFPYDFRDERVMSHVREVAESCVGLEEDTRGEVSLVLQSLLEKLTSLERYEAYIHSVRAHATASLGSLSQVSL